ncbi:hypothetical protein EEZ25_34060, partial [Micromonospora aurantiaca]
IRTEQFYARNRRWQVTYWLDAQVDEIFVFQTATLLRTVERNPDFPGVQDVSRTLQKLLDGPLDIDPRRVETGVAVELSADAC